MTGRGALSLAVCCLALVGAAWAQLQDGGSVPRTSSPDIKTTVTNRSDVSATVSVRTISNSMLPSKLIGPGSSATFESSSAVWTLEGHVTVDGRNVTLQPLCMVFGSLVSSANQCISAHGAGVTYNTKWEVTSRIEGGTKTYYFAKD